MFGENTTQYICGNYALLFFFPEWVFTVLNDARLVRTRARNTMGSGTHSRPHRNRIHSSDA